MSNFSVAFIQFLFIIYTQTYISPVDCSIFCCSWAHYTLLNYSTRQWLKVL